MKRGMRVLALALALFLSFSVLFACAAEDVKENESGSDEANSTSGSNADEKSTTEDTTGGSSVNAGENDPVNDSSEGEKNYVKMTVCYTDSEGQEITGELLIKLCPEYAPITVANFKKLVKSGFYDGLTFHRVIEGFMIQGGDPKGDGTGGSKNDIKGEFSKNGVNNTILHERGVISMARSGERRNNLGQIIDYGYNSASSQFFIVHKTSPHLDDNYAAFGHVVFGMTSVDGIATVATNSSDKPLQEAKIESAVFVNYNE